jgi:hypothetical protein
MFRRLALVVLSLLLLFLPRIALAQQFGAGPPPDEKPAPAIEKKAFDLLETISEQVANLHSPSNRIRAECVIADLLWIRDEKRARALFKTAADDLANVVANIDFGEPDVYQQLMWLSQQRSDMINRLAAHDPDAALSLLRATQLGAAIDPRAKWYIDTETSLELRLAGMIAKQNPARALELARATLPRGVSYSVIGLLNEMQRKDPRSAQILYKEMVDQIKSEDLEKNYDLAEPAWNLLWFQPPQANEDTYRELIGTLINSTLTITPTDQISINVAQNVYSQLQSLMPQIEKYAPARTAALRQWSQNAERSFDPNVRMYQELNRLAQDGTVEDILALAPRYSAELQAQIYSQAAWKALGSGDATRARQIITDLISDPVQRKQMLAQIDNQSLEMAISQDKIADVRPALSRMKQVERRVQVLVRLATVLAGKGDKKGALELLNEARTATDSAPSDPGQMGAQLLLAQSYASLDPDQSFAMVQPLIVKINALIAAATVLDGFDAHYLKDGEWITPGSNMLGNLVGNLNRTLTMLARLDFDRARSAADQIERPELRLTANLGIASAALGGKTINPPPGARIISLEGRID